jgi:peptidoglycan/xylan/chitin deacetylase (PgdA/CDA1 family)
VSVVSDSLRDRTALLARRLGAEIAAATGITHRRLARRRGMAGVLMYHRVLPDGAPDDGIEPGMYVRASTFERQIAWLRARWKIEPLGRLMAAAPRPGEPARIALTFDDGWRDNLSVAWPILERHAVRATIFLVRDFSEAGDHPWGEFLRPQEIRDLARQGMEFGAHTVSHPALDRLDDEQAEREMRGSKQAVEDWTGARCELFAYPYGRHRESTATIARRLFRGSVVVGGGWWIPGDDPGRIPRIGIHEDMTSSTAMFAKRIAA